MHSISSSSNEKWKIAQERKKEPTHSGEINNHKNSIGNAGIPKRNPKMVVLRVDEDDMSQDSTIAETIDMEKRKNNLKRNKKESHESSEQDATREGKTLPSRRFRSKERSKRRSTSRDGRRGHSSDGRRSSSKERVSTTNAIGLPRRQRAASQERPIRSRSKDSSAKFKQEDSKTSRSRSQERNGATTSRSACNSRTFENCTNTNKLIQRSASRERTNVRNERGRTDLLKVPSHSKRRERVKSTSHCGSTRVTDSTFQITTEPRRCQSHRDSGKATSVVNSSVRRLPKGTLDGRPCPTSHSHTKSSVDKQVPSHSFSMPADTSVCSFDQTLTKLRNIDSVFDGNVSIPSLSGSKPTSERTISTHGSLPLKEPCQPGDPPAKRPQRYRRTRQSPKGRQQTQPIRPVLVKSDSNRFLEVVKEASSIMPVAPRRSVSPVTAKKKKASKAIEGEPLPRGKESQGFPPETSERLDWSLQNLDVSQGISKTHRASQSLPESKKLLSRTSRSESEGPSSNAPPSITSVKGGSNLDDRDTAFHSSILNFKVEEWDTDDDDELGTNLPPTTTSKVTSLTGHETSNRNLLTSRRGPRVEKADRKQ